MNGLPRTPQPRTIRRPRRPRVGLIGPAALLVAGTPLTFLVDPLHASWRLVFVVDLLDAS